VGGNALILARAEDQRVAAHSYYRNSCAHVCSGPHPIPPPRAGEGK
jgi:hypothetical protein